MVREERDYNRDAGAAGRHLEEENFKMKESISLYILTLAAALLFLSSTALFFFFLIKCKKYIDQKEQDKLAIQAGNQQNRANSSQENRLP